MRYYNKVEKFLKNKGFDINYDEHHGYPDLIAVKEDWKIYITIITAIFGNSPTNYYWNIMNTSKSVDISDVTYQLNQNDLLYILKVNLKELDC